MPLLAILRHWRIYPNENRRTRRYVKDLKRIGATDTDVSRVERAIAANPEAGDLVQGLGGIRKIRFGLGNRGKSGGGRAIYFLRLADDTALMLTAYAKNERLACRRPTARRFSRL